MLTEEMQEMFKKMLKKITLEELDEEIKKRNLLKEPPEKRFKSLIENANAEVLTELERNKVTSWNMLCKWRATITEHKEEDRLAELATLMTRARNATTNIKEFTEELIKKMNGRFEPKIIIATLAVTIWPGDTMARSRILCEETIDGAQYAIECILDSKRRKRNKIKNNKNA